MSLLAIGLLVLSAGLHASWNLLLKQSRDKVIFNWWTILISFLFTLPLLLWVKFELTGTAVGLVAASATFETLYLISLGQSYDRGDFSLVYPLARGSAPLFIALGALATLGEHPSRVGWVGIVLIVAGILASSAYGREKSIRPRFAAADPAVRSALLTGLFIASYSVVDKVGIAHLPVPVYLCLVFGGITVLLAPYLIAQRSWREVRDEWRQAKGPIITVSILAFLAYALVLFAMRQAPVSYVGSAREISVVFGGLIGTLVLKERFGLLRVATAAVIFAGIVCLALTS